MIFVLSVEAEKSEKAKIKLPRQPEIWEIYKSLDKEKYKPDLISIQDQQMGLDPSDEISQRIFPGFVGPYAIELIDGKVIKVIENSLNVSDDEYWAVMGLIRNETLSTIGEVDIEAILKDKDGNTLEKVKGQVLVGNIRPGEPAPFKINSNIPTLDVSNVEYVTALRSSEKNSIRELNITPAWELPYGVQTLGQMKREDAPYPYLLHVGFDNLGKSVQDVSLVVAWLSPEGQVAWIIESELDKELYANGVPIDGSADFNVINVNDPSIGPLLIQYQYMTWAEGY